MDFIGKIAKQAISLTISRQIAKRLGKHLDRAGDALEKTLQARRETKQLASRERARMTRGVAGTEVDASESAYEKRETEWEKQRPAYREELVGMLSDLKFDDEIAERAVDQILDDVAAELHHYGVPSPKMLSTAALRRARSLRRVWNAQQKLEERARENVDIDRDTEDNE